MNKREMHIDNVTWRRVNKAEARRVYNAGLTINLAPCNANLCSLWWNGGYITNKERHETEFDALVNSFEYYNCNCSELGRYAAFYIPVVYVDKFTGEKVDRGTSNAVVEYDYSYTGV